MFAKIIPKIYYSSTLKTTMVIFSSIVIFYLWDFGAKYLLDTSLALPWWAKSIYIKLLTLTPLLFFFKKDLLITKGFFPILLIGLYVIFQYIYNFIVFDKIFTTTDLKFFLGFSLTMFVVFLSKKIILLNKKKISLFLIYLSPFFVLADNFYFWSKEDLLWQCSFLGNDSNIFKLFFLESSHYGMVAIPVFLLNLFYLCKKFNLINFLLLIIFSSSMILFFSTTMAVGTILSIAIILLTNFRNINAKFFLSCVIVMFVYVLIFVNAYGCSRRISDLFYHHYILSVEKIDILNSKNKNTAIQDSRFIVTIENNIAKLIIFTYTKFTKKNKQETERSQNLKDSGISDKLVKLNDLQRERVFNKINVTSQVASNSFEVALKTLYAKPFGVGLNRFIDAFKDQIKSQQQYYSSEIMKINLSDGSSNLAKLIAEFGVVSFVVFAYFIIFIFSKKISIENKLFLFPLVLTQIIRGAGYFNGGFLAAVVLIILIVHENKEKN